MKMFYDPPRAVKNVFPNFKWETSSGKILLTFDDGPLPETTPRIIEELAKRNLKALFFCVGENIRKYPDSLLEILNEGHSVGNHTFNHKDLLFCTTEETKRQIGLFDETFSLVAGGSVKYFRPPKGRIPLIAGGNYLSGKTCVMWNMLTRDYKNDVNIVKFAVQKYLKANSIIVLHDSLKSINIITEAIDFIEREAHKRHLEFGEPEECLK